MQREVIRRLARGEKTDSIARELRMSKNTLYVHRGAAIARNGATGLMDLLRTLNRTRGQSVVVVTHALEVGEQTDRIVRMRDGRIDA